MKPEDNNEKRMGNNWTEYSQRNGFFGQLTKLGTGLAIIVGLAGAYQGIAVLPYRVTAAEAKVDKLMVEKQLDHDILVRINAQLEDLRVRMADRWAKVDKDEQAKMP